MEIDLIKQIVGEGEYEYYGIRAASNLEVGQIAPNSYRWEDGTQTDEELNGASAIQIKSDISAAVESLSIYSGAHMVLLGSCRFEHGEDDGEIVMRDAVVLAVWERRS